MKLFVQDRIALFDNVELNINKNIMSIVDKHAPFHKVRIKDRKGHDN